jgi:osmotically-inducible protein OsmY
MKTLVLLILLAALGAGYYWWVNNGHRGDQLRQAEDQTAQQANKLQSTIRDKLKDLAPSTSALKEELERTGKVVRKKAEQVGTVLADATADARITATIKAKLVKDPRLSALRISVSTTDGVVTLSGSVDSVDDIQQALKLALDTDGVREAISTLQVKANKPE